MTDTISTIIIFDTETTDIDPAVGAEICEIGWVPIHLENGKWEFGIGFSTLVETEAVMHPAARAAHHIHPDLVKPGAPNCLPRSTIIHEMLAGEEPGEMLYAAHNAPFDLKFLPELTLGCIDTYQCAKHLFEDSPRYGNQVLRYYLDAEPPPELLEGLAPHRALYDAACTAAILIKMLELRSPLELVRLSTTPLLQKTCGFGKHKDRPWSEVPLDYLAWVIRANDMYQNDPNIRYTVDYYYGNLTTPQSNEVTGVI